MTAATTVEPSRVENALAEIAIVLGALDPKTDSAEDIARVLQICGRIIERSRKAP